MRNWFKTSLGSRNVQSALLAVIRNQLIPRFDRTDIPLDPFDYEQKYAPDKEMSERSRFFQTYQDESTKFDVDMVENWRDGLDILLVLVSAFLISVDISELTHTPGSIVLGRRYHFCRADLPEPSRGLRASHGLADTSLDRRGGRHFTRRPHR